ncbi:hypothetical protein DFP93_101139 [Aneurinibacillus soli]|uniref:Uncharacterized protein n=1 Tax=Aneurinibacillus soli TaxID=1500254 RepID=A0A0U5B3V9_9BACL|nr:hypothetical protein [Aneurinibacillus soli]PYE64114.1 hypothetical protein DFP93_101139 [Aneurinibacillus soli]BAU28063.1 hypothetical protein CB4_02237 [Aneurinibacillus soli]
MKRESSEAVQKARTWRTGQLFRDIDNVWRWEWEKGGAVRFGTLAGKWGCPFQEPGELARKEKPPMLIH